MEMLQVFYVTFGVQYRSEAHPHWPNAHPDGVLEVIAPDIKMATQAVQMTLGEHYAFLYREGEMRWDYHPRGIIGTITFTGIIDR